MRLPVLLALALLSVAGSARSQVSLPLKHLHVTSAFGNRIHPVTGAYRFHAGVDLRARQDTVFSVLDGCVTATGYNPLLGIFIKIQTGQFLVTYGHLSQCFVRKGDTTAANCRIAITGATGRVTGEHLHFSVQFNLHYIDPLAFISVASQKTNNQ